MNFLTAAVRDAAASLAGLAPDEPTLPSMAFLASLISPNA